MNRVRQNPLVPAAAASPSGWLPVLAAGLITLATIAVYANSLNAPFLFDDSAAITRNATIRHLWSSDILTAPLNATGATGRPLVNLSLAINYALGGIHVQGYHVFNLLLHLASALLLFGIVRHTLMSPALRAQWTDAALPVSAGTALLWALHPLQTESVTGVIQRTELLGGFFLLLTLYCFLRSAETQEDHSAGPPRHWAIAAVTASALGMAAKEFMVVAPLLVLLYDRTFFAGTFRAAWSRHRRLYLGLGMSWLILALILSQTPQRNQNVGFGLGLSAWDYLLTQCHAIVLYLKLSVWPRPLVLDYGTAIVTRFTEVWWQAALLVALFTGTIWALWRRPAIGFLGAWFFVILAPSSSFVPLVTQTVAEHRMYLPLAAVVLAGVLALRFYFPRYAVVISLVLAGGGAWLTEQRNQEYASAVSIWSDTARSAPENYRAHYNLANALAAAGRTADAIPSYETALALRPDLSAIHHNLALILGQLGRNSEAIEHFESAVRFDPRAADTRINFAAVLVRAGRLDEAADQYRHATRLEPGAADVHASLAYVLQLQGRVDESIHEYQAALQLDPSNENVRATLNEELQSQPAR